MLKSGVSFGSGLTYALNKKKVNGITYCDTPGLNDAKKREAAGKAISKALKVRNFMYVRLFIHN